jgi:hypothetical protein
MTYPHCDSNVLHPPGQCWACDLYPDLQLEREQNGINYTGYNDPALKPDPALEHRPLDSINSWWGNVENDGYDPWRCDICTDWWVPDFANEEAIAHAEEHNHRVMRWSTWKKERGL